MRLMLSVVGFSVRAVGQAIGVYSLKATPREPILPQNRADVLCIVQAQYRQASYIGCSSHCQRNPWTLSNSTLCSVVTESGGFRQSWCSLPLDVTRMTLAGAYVEMQRVHTPDHAQPGGDYGLFLDGTVGLSGIEGHRSDWWLCPIPDGSEGMALNYGYHTGYGLPQENAACIPIGLSVAAL